MISIEEQIDNLLFAGDELKADRTFMKKAIEMDEKALKYVSESLQNDRELVELAINKYGGMLKFASKNL